MACVYLGYCNLFYSPNDFCLLNRVVEGKESKSLCLVVVERGPVWFQQWSLIDIYYFYKVLNNVYW